MTAVSGWMPSSITARHTFRGAQVQTLPAILTSVFLFQSVHRKKKDYFNDIRCFRLRLDADASGFA